MDFKLDKVPPSLDTCLERAGIQSVVTHKALDDARDVIRVLRKKY
jgi:inhibitor of KinA sporulation pathway (predicted exonuclease)